MVSEIMSSTLTDPDCRRFNAGSKRPQREPTRVISFTMTGAVSKLTDPWIVDFMNTVPRGRVICTACLRPAAEPVASTTQPYALDGSFFFAINGSTPDLSAIFRFDLWWPYRWT